MRTPSLARALILFACTTLLVAGCNGDDSPDASSGSDEPTSEETTSEPPPPPPPAPEEGRCYRLSEDALASAHSDAHPVSCKKGHTGQTYLVAKLRKSLTEADPLDSTAIADTVSERCEKAFAGHVGGDDDTRTLARVHAVWFAPSEEELGLGARWFRCDVAADKRDGAPARLPSETKGMLDADDALDDWGTCAPADSSSPEADARLCSQPHGLRAISVVNVGDPDASWPGSESLRGEGEDCEAAVRDYLDDSTSSLTFQWTFPTRSQWKSGRRYGLCWTEDE